MEKIQIEKYINRIDLLNETIEQIKKDFAETHLTILFSGNPQTAYTEMAEQILPFISSHYQKNYSFFLQVLYRIDIPEKLLKNILQKDVPEAMQKITDIIIKRELQKVVIRNYYRENH